MTGVVTIVDGVLSGRYLPAAAEKTDFRNKLSEVGVYSSGPPEESCSEPDFFPNLTGGSNVRLIERTHSGRVVDGCPGQETRQKT